MDKFLTHAHTSSKAQSLMGETTPLATTKGNLGNAVAPQDCAAWGGFIRGQQL